MNTMYIRSTGNDRFSYEIIRFGFSETVSKGEESIIWLPRIAKSSNLRAVVAKNGGAYDLSKRIAAELNVEFFAPLG